MPTSTTDTNLLRPRRPHTTTDVQSNWWSSGDTTSITSGSESVSQPSDAPPPASSTLTTTSPTASGSGSSAGSDGLASVFTTSFPLTTITQPSTTFTSYSQSLVTTIPSISSSTSGPEAFSSPPNQFAALSQPVCIGDGLDASADGMIATLILPGVIGLVLWVIFAIIRPRYRQIYGLREWFVQPDLRPKPLGSSLWAFLFPHVPLVPSVPSDVTDAGRSPATDAFLFPSDEQLSQRALWVSLLIVLGWTIVGLGGALPLYLVSTPCLAKSPNTAIFGGAYSTLQDLSLIRLLRLLDSGNVNTITAGFSSINAREIVDGEDLEHRIRIRIIILTVLVLVVALLPALYKIMKEFNRMVAYRRRWVEIRCEGKEMGWLSARDAPGFVGWGEKRLKDFLLKTGLSSSLEANGSGNGGRNGVNGNGNGHTRSRRRNEEQPLNYAEEANLEIDIRSLFSIGDTQQLALLIDERDEILENLEIAETRYISSFRITTPDPSIADFQPPPIPEDPNRPYISRPLPLAPGLRGKNRRGRRAVNPAFAASSLAPTSFVAPSQYYKLRGVQGVSGGRFDTPIEELPSLSESINSRVIGSRFQEVNRNSVAYGRLPLGSHVKVEKSGELGPHTPVYSTFLDSPIPDPRRYGPNHAVDSSETEPETDDRGTKDLDSTPPDGTAYLDDDDEWVDPTTDGPINFDYNGPPPVVAGPSSARRRPKKDPVSAARRETFPLRIKHGAISEGDEVPPPHLRLQPSQPFVRPMSGINHDDLGVVYGDIRQWRSRLKIINAEITESQRESYNDIADGARIKGWLMVGRGLRFIPGIQLIEGRAKEDIRWDVLQNERSALDTFVLWIVIGVVVILLAAGLTAASGLSLGTAPNVAHYLPFLEPLVQGHTLGSGIATILAPAVGATFFIILALAVVNWAAGIRGSVSISGGQLLAFKATFFILTAIAAIWLITIGAILFAIQEFSSNTERTKFVANGSIYMSVLALAIVINVAIIFPAILLLQPFRLWHVIRAERHAVTPRQRFRAVYPRIYNPSFATGACVLAMAFASAFSLIFPLIGPAVVVLLFLTLIAHRYLVGYVYARTHSQTGGLLQIWLLRRFGSLLCLQPLLLGLIYLSRQFWIEGGILLAAALIVIVFVEVYATWKTKLPGPKSLSPITQDSLDTFKSTAKPTNRPNVDEESTSLVSSARGTRMRGSMASVLEMMSLTLAVMPSPSLSRGPVPLHTETLDDLTATERAARTHPDAPPHLPPLPFTDHAEEMAGILYAPELIAPPPIIWLPNDSAGVARSEAVDLQKYHDLQVTLDVRAKEDVMVRRSTSSRGRS